MNAPVESVPVIQADRDAAKSLLGRDDAGPSWWSIDSGNADCDLLVQAFARHRTNQVTELVEVVSAYLAWGERAPPAAFQEAFPQFAERGVDAIDERARALLASHKGEQP